MVNKVFCPTCGKRKKVVMNGELYICRRCKRDLTVEVLERKEYLKAHQPESPKEDLKPDKVPKENDKDDEEFDEFPEEEF